ncbi:MAG TPA: peptidase M28, partial [Planctomycetota bacterium]|nr:peptidase M28 [Planctomycetota bacterium]
MWEAIQSNRRRSVLLLWTLAAVLIGLGAAVGAAVHPEAVPLGIAGALVVWGVLYAVAALAGDRIVLSVAGAQKLEKADAPQLFNVVEEMVIASGLGRMPDIYLIPDDRPNAFAAGR